MGEEQEESAASDGAIDFSGYSIGQLQEMRAMLDRNAYPRNFANLLAEINRRAGGVDAQPVELGAVHTRSQAPAVGRFTRNDGWRGWLQALRRRAPIFGPGVLEVTDDEVKLLGNRRTWLGVTEPGEYAVPLARIRNAVLDGTTLRFEFKSKFWPSRTVIFDSGSSAHAQELLERLPQQRSAGFEKRWRETREFNERLNTLGGRHWVTPALVIANVLAFAAMLVASKSLVPDQTRLLEWGANFGPLTTSGQWWRIVTSMFLHGGWAHLLLNMWVLWNVGRLTERLFGSATFAFLYFASGICGSFARTLWDPSISSIGASGAIFGVVGALLAMLLHRGARIPRSIALAHWPSTLLFTLFNLVGGAFDPLIDNAVHSGGLLSGVLFGWALVRPVDEVARRAFPARQVAAVSLIAALLGGACYAHLRTAGGQASVPERYMLERQWYSKGEAENLQLWNELGMRASSGTISRVELADSFEKKIVPFWKGAQDRLEQAARSLPAAQQPMDKLLREFVRLRLAWAEAIVQAARDGDARKGAEVVKLAGDAQKVLAGLLRYSMRANLDQRPRALANSAPIVRIRNYFAAGSSECVSAPTSSGELPAFSDSVNDGPKARARTGCQAQHLFVTGDYQSLEDLIAHSAQTPGDSRDGGSSLSGVFSGLDNYFEYSHSEIEHLMGKTSDWRRSVKDDVGAELTEILLFREWAWTARGSGYADSVSPQDWELFAIRLEMAAYGLREIEQRASNNPYWYQLSLQVRSDQQAESDELDKLFAEGVRRFPGYLPIYSARMRAMMPRWGGSTGRVDLFIQSAADEHRGTLESDEWYAMLYSIYSSMERDDINIFAAGNADWGRVQDGFDRLRQRYPRSDAVLNQYAKLACAAGDAEKYRALRPLVGARPSSTCWSAKRSLESCDKMFQRVPAQP